MYVVRNDCWANHVILMTRKIQMEGRKWKADKMEESLHCSGLDTITRERYKQKITTYVGCNPYVMKRSNFSTKLKYLPAIEVVDTG